MKIFALRGDDNQACGFYRIQLPVEQAVAEGFIEAEISTDLPADADVGTDGSVTVHRINTDADIIIFQRPLLHAFLPAMRQAQRQGITCIVELDDDLAGVDPDNLAYKAVHPRYNSASNYEHLLAACAEADWVTVSTPRLAERYASHGRVSVLRNCLPESVFDIKKTFQSPPRVGWSGSMATHPHDLEELGVHLRTVLHETNASFSMLGEDDGVRQTLRFNDSTQFQCSPWVDIEHYHEALSQTFDIGIVPLALTPFNEAKSYLKGLEMAGLGIPFVASPTAEYIHLSDRGAGLIASKRTHWQKHLRKLITNPDFLLEESARARSAVRSLTYENRVSEWVMAWTQALNSRYQR